MNLDDRDKFSQLDRSNMREAIDYLPDQLAQAWEQGLNLPLRVKPPIRHVVIAGMGGSAIGADLFIAYGEPFLTVPVVTCREYQLPAWARGSEILVIGSSHSGNTEETLSAVKQAGERGCQVVAIATGGELAAVANEAGWDVWQFEHHGQPRAAVGFSFGFLLALFTRLGFIPDPTHDLEITLQAMREQQQSLGVEVPVVRNPAKRLAGQLMGRWVVVIGSDVAAPVARRWKGQINELAKAWAQFDILPEADHNTLAGIENPEALLEKMMVLFLRTPSDHPRNRLRNELTLQAFLTAGINVDFVQGKGEGRMAHQWTLLHFGDYLAYYLAMAYGVDPTPVQAIEGLKAVMKE
ncbi:bifunctional phosphoglucose/phosphomannose isomerase [uncultured Thermanaerothrix sp.]|uniref:bifunctional phosphoglucose/phosphomannose isomerase n=1 Tax=uncultured Thermanaerothrix sp. TaxID=1195149 RepID=UPI002610A4BC|nr:bifunctional phosphoglucose/phosphomannose isomerase [uncultured Thermanaerothrix sp.]